MLRRKTWLLPIIGVFLFRCGGASHTQKEFELAVIPKGTTHEFWKSIHAGAERASQELTGPDRKVNIYWTGPLREDDREQQIRVVENFISRQVDGIVLAPLDDRSLVRPVEEALRAGIPTVVIDSGLASKNIISFVATDNRRGGELAAERIGERLNGKGKTILLRYQEGSDSTTNREQGFLSKMKSAYPHIAIISSDQYAGATRDTAKRASENLLNRFGGQVDAIFTPNETATSGMLLALQDIHKAGEVTLVGFDITGEFVEAMRKGQLHGVVVQNPFKMGYLGVSTMVEHLEGRKVQERIDTGVYLVTPENLDDPKMREIIHPPVK